MPALIDDSEATDDCLNSFLVMFVFEYPQSSDSESADSRCEFFPHGLDRASDEFILLVSLQCMFECFPLLSSHSLRGNVFAQTNSTCDYFREPFFYLEY